MKIAIALFVGALLVPAGVQAQPNHSVRGYVKRDGTYVAPARRTNPNSTRNDNWTTKPNVNPYTGKAGTKSPDYIYKAPKPKRSY